MSRILIIEDDDLVRSMLRITLERAGYDVSEAEDGDEGMRIYREHPADLVVTDILMPGKEGLETIIELRKENPSVKIFAISGGGRINPENYLDLAVKFGATRAFSKPVDRKVLMDAVEEAVGKPESD